MIGIFDSGVGGFNSYYELRRLLPRADVVYLADRKNAPYGKRRREELIPLVTEDIHRLAERGAEKILIACCTASAVWCELGAWERSISLPIISPAARAAVRVTDGGVTVIATEATVSLGVFKKEISSISPATSITEIAAQELVSLVEGGCRDGRISADGEKILSALAVKINETHADTLVLGCTHFSHLEKTLFSLTKMKIISPAKEGARLIARECAPKALEGGRTVYL